MEARQGAFPGQCEAGEGALCQAKPEGGAGRWGSYVSLKVRARGSAAPPPRRLHRRLTNSSLEDTFQETVAASS